MRHRNEWVESEVADNAKTKHVEGIRLGWKLTFNTITAAQQLHCTGLRNAEDKCIPKMHRILKARSPIC